MSRRMIPVALAPYMGKVMEKNRENHYSLIRRGSEYIMDSDISNRQLHRYLQEAEVMKLSDKKGIPHVSRFDIGRATEGVIPKYEARQFRRAAL